MLLKQGLPVLHSPEFEQISKKAMQAREALKREHENMLLSARGFDEEEEGGSLRCSESKGA